MSIEVVIIDDEPRAIDLLCHYISQIERLEVKQTFRSPLKASQYLRTAKTDLLFLDINMPRLSGLDLFKNLQNKPHVIFTTAHAEYAIDGFDLDAIDYLLKPISFPRFLKALQKLDRFNTEKDRADFIPADPLFIKSGITDYKVLWCDIKFLEKNENYVVFHLLNGQRILSRATLGGIEKIFPAYVVRTHKSFAVCLYNILSTESNRVFVHDFVIPIGRTYKNFFHEQYQEHRKLLSK